MTAALRWQPCVNHRPDEIERFIAEYFGKITSKVLLIAGAGFDPRATSVAQLLKRYCRPLPDGIFVKEDRISPDGESVNRANANLARLKLLVNQATVIQIDVFAQDGAVVGGRALLQKLQALDLAIYSDVLIDTSALSVGISFPLVKYVLFKSEALHKNVHLFASDRPSLDHAIRPLLAERATNIHGFKRVNELYSGGAAAKLWLPQLAPSRGVALQRIFDEVQPNDTCPILPFPCADPKLADRLLSEYAGELENAWSVDARSLIYADENDPLGLYRTIVRISDERRRSFEALGGSLLILSPLGSKMLAIGALMAALDRDLPIYYVESRGYEIDWNTADDERYTPAIRHVWLAGEAYPQGQFAAESK